MTFDTRIALYLMGELVAALRANDPDLFKRWLCGSDHSLRKLVVAKVQARGGAQINLKPANRRPHQQGSGEPIGTQISQSLLGTRKRRQHIIM